MEQRTNLLVNPVSREPSRLNRSSLRLRNFKRAFVRGRHEHEDGICRLAKSSLMIGLGNGKIVSVPQLRGGDMPLWSPADFVRESRVNSVETKMSLNTWYRRTRAREPSGNEFGWRLEVPCTSLGLSKVLRTTVRIKNSQDLAFFSHYTKSCTDSRPV